MNESIPQGTRRLVDGELRTFYEGYWIKTYVVPDDTLSAKKRLIEGLTRRLFNHVEHGINVPGKRLEEARRSFDAEIDPKRRRIKGAMLAGALFNRVTDIFTKLVEMQALGIEIQRDNALMRECGRHLQEALSLGRLVLHRSGEEGIDELWGEPFKAFSVPLEDFYESRYVKIGLTMRDIDRIADALVETFDPLPMFRGIASPVRAYANAARIKCETLQTDEDIFEVWSAFVVAGETLTSYAPEAGKRWTASQLQGFDDALVLIRRGRDLVSDIARARTPMPKTTANLIEHCAAFRVNYTTTLAAAA